MLMGWSTLFKEIDFIVNVTDVLAVRLNQRTEDNLALIHHNDPDAKKDPAKTITSQYRL